MSGFTRFEMSTASEQAMGAAEQDSEASRSHRTATNTSSGATSPPAYDRIQAVGDENQMRTGKESGDRSASARGSVLVAGGAPGPTITALQRLAADLDGDYTIVERFVSDYLGLLDQRLAGLARLLRGQDAEATKVWVLSLETTSSMLGAADVVSSARAVREAVGHGSDEAALAAFGRLQQDVRALQACLGGLRLTVPPQSSRAGG